MNDPVARVNLQNTGSLMGAWTWQLETNKVEWSKNLFTIFGLDPQKMRGANLYEEFFKIVHPEDLATVKKVNSEVQNQREPVSLAFRIVLPDGRVRHIVSEPDAMLGSDGQVISMTGIIRDQTWENRIGQLLLHYKSALDEHSIVAMTDRIGRISYANEKFCEISGYSREELLGKNHRILNSGYHTEEFFRNLYATIFSGKTWQGEIRNRRKDGSLYWVDTTIVPFTDSMGDVVEFLAIRTDITARKASQKILLDTSHRLAEAQRLSHTGSWEWEADSGQVYLSDEMYRIFNFKHNEFDGSAEMASNAFHPDDRAAVTELAKRAIAEQRPQRIDARILLPDGSVRFVHGETEAEFDADGNLVRVRGTYQDITSCRKIELALRESRESYQRLFEQTTECLFISDGEGRFLEVNHAAEELTGYAAEELLRMGIKDLADFSEDNPPRLAELRAGWTLSAERTICRKSGDRIQVEVRARKISDGRILAIVRDLTLQRQLEHSLLQSQKLESLAVLAGGISHDFNNLLSGMFGYAELAKKKNHDAQIAHYLLRVIEGLERSQNLTQRLMTFARGGEPRRSTGHLFPHVRDTVTFVLSGLNCRAHFDIAADLHPCEYDPVQIAQVFDNLVRNAQQAMPAGGLIAISARNENIADGMHALLAPGHYVRVSVTDTGYGIPEENLGRLFDPFFSTKPEGHGLGLASSYSIVKRHGGLIEVSSTPGKGSAFHVVLPASPDAVVPDSATTTPESPVPAEAGIILVMDDEDIVRDSLSGLLQSLGYRVVAVEDGRSALDFHARAFVERRLPVAIILDLTIPGSMGGKEVVAEIRKTDKTTPVFVSSGYSEGTIMADPVSFGFNAALPKPVRLADLNALLKNFLSAE